MGIPNVGGEVFFDASYNGNNLVNAMAVGIGKRGDLHKGIAKGTGGKMAFRVEISMPKKIRGHCEVQVLVRTCRPGQDPKGPLEPWNLEAAQAGFTIN